MFKKQCAISQSCPEQFKYGHSLIYTKYSILQHKLSEWNYVPPYTYLTSQRSIRNDNSAWWASYNRITYIWTMFKIPGFIYSLWSTGPCELDIRHRQHKTSMIYLHPPVKTEGTCSLDLKNSPCNKLTMPRHLLQ